MIMEGHQVEGPASVKTLSWKHLLFKEETEAGVPNANQTDIIDLHSKRVTLVSVPRIDWHMGGNNRSKEVIYR